MPNFKIQDILSRISHMAMPINCSLNSEHIFLKAGLTNKTLASFFSFFLKKSLVLV